VDSWYNLGTVMQRHAIALAIALQAIQIVAVIRVVMEDRGAAIAAGEDMNRTRQGRRGVACGHGGHSGWRTLRQRSFSMHRIACGEIGQLDGQT